MRKCQNVSYCGQQCGSLRYGTGTAGTDTGTVGTGASPCPSSSCHQQSPCPPPCHPHQGCQRGCYHSLLHNNHMNHEHMNHALNHTLNHAHNHAHNHGQKHNKYPNSKSSDFEKDVDLACQTVIFKEVNTCNPATITGTLSRISLDEEDDLKLSAHQEGGLGVNFSSLPGNIPPPNLLVQLSDTPVKKEVNVEQQMHQGNPRNTAPVYLCTESGMGWSRPPPPPNTLDGPGGGGEGDYMVLPRRTVSLKPPLPPGLGLGLGGEDKPLSIAVDDPPFPPPPSPMTLHPVESEAYPADFISPSDHNMNMNMDMNMNLFLRDAQAAPRVHIHGGHMHGYGHSLQLKPGQMPSVRQILTGGGGTVERTLTMPRNLGSTNTNTSLSAGSLEVKREGWRDGRREGWKSVFNQ
ncbi:unnamed protein product, partial [Coregonus sp. 'balchen']